MNLKIKDKETEWMVALIAGIASSLLGLAVLVKLNPPVPFAEPIAKWIMRLLGYTVVLALFVPQPAESQSAPVPGYDYSFAGGLSVSSPVNPGQENGPLLVGAICVGAIVGVVYAGIKIWSMCLDIQWRALTNNVHELPLPTSPVPTAANPGTTDCSCGAPPAPGQPLPLEIQHSYDGRDWDTVAAGVGIGSEFVLPATGYWRAVPMLLSMSRVDGALVLHAPPGVLEHSDDLRAWAVVAVNTQGTDMAALPGFYRVRLN
jgi:hypothetical protein